MLLDWELNMSGRGFRLGEWLCTADRDQTDVNRTFCRWQVVHSELRDILTDRGVG
jgi:hypothetical protein